MIFIFFVAGLMIAIGLIIFFAKELKESNHEIKAYLCAGAERNLEQATSKPRASFGTRNNTESTRGESEMKKGQLESGVLHDCLRVMKERGIFCWRQNTGAFKVENRFFRSSRAGVSDILGVMPNGRFIAVECKREIGGRVSDKQWEFLEAVENNNGIAFIAHSGEELAVFLDKVQPLLNIKM